MAEANLGSIQAEILDLVDNVPTVISGVRLDSLIYRQVKFMEAYTGQSIGSTAIADKFQPALMNFSMAELLDVMGIQGADVNSIKLGPFSVSKGAGANTTIASDRLREQAYAMLNQEGQKIRFFKALG